MQVNGIRSVINSSLSVLLKQKGGKLGGKNSFTGWLKEVKIKFIELLPPPPQKKGKVLCIVVKV